MKANSASKFHLQDLHQEIDFSEPPASLGDRGQAFQQQEKSRC